MVGLLAAEQPRQFQGRLTIAGQAANVQRFTFDVRAQDPQTPRQ